MRAVGGLGFGGAAAYLDGLCGLFSRLNGPFWQQHILLGVYLLVVQANLAQPVRLSPAAWGLLGAFLLTTFGGLVRMIWRLRVVPPATAAA